MSAISERHYNELVVTVRQRVAEGVRRLDALARKPPWRERVQQALGEAERSPRTTLPMSSCRNCLLGKIFGDFVRGLRELILDDDSAWQYGFDRSHGDPVEVWDILEDAWLEEIYAEAADGIQHLRASS